MKNPLRLIQSSWQLMINSSISTTETADPESGSLLQILEERYLYDASPIGALLSTQTSDPHVGEAIDHQILELIELCAETHTEFGYAPVDIEHTCVDLALGTATENYDLAMQLVVIDERVENVDQLIADLTDETVAYHVVSVGVNDDAIQQITNLLTGDRQFDAVHVISHGSAGQLQLGNTQLTADNLEHYQSQLSAWTSGLSFGADILIYGCDVATADEAPLLAEQVGQFFDDDGIQINLGPDDHTLVVPTSGGLIQFATDAGHVLGFDNDSILIASSSHLFQVDFVGAQPIDPVASDSTFSSVSYVDVWDGVTAVFESQDGAILKSTYFIDGGSDEASVDQIQLHYNRDVSLDAQGNLVVAFDTGTMTDSAPIAWQDIDGERVFVDVYYELLGHNLVGFEVGDFDHSHQLVIDPTLTWTSFLGGSGSDYASGIAVDGSGNVYVTGNSDATWGSPVRAFSGTATEAYVAKLNSSGSLVWNTFLGGATGGDQTDAITVDGSGNVYVTGWSGATWGSPVRSFGGGGQDAFVAKLNNSGTLTWNTFLGGTGQDEGTGIAVDGSGNVYISGYGNATWGSPVRAYGGGGNDAFAVKLNSSGALTWNTFLGGGGNDAGTAIAVDGSGNTYLTGNSAASWGSPVRAFSSGTDAFAAKVTTAGALAWNTFLGGSGNDFGNAIALDASGNVYVGGNSGATWGTPVQGFAGGTTDALVVKLNSSGGLAWNTFVGGTAIDGANGIAVGSNGNIYLTGNSGASWGTPWRGFGGGSYDAFAAEMNSSGSIVSNGFLGGSGNDYGYGIATDNGGNVYVAGYGSAAWGSPVRSYSGGTDGFVAKINLSTTLSQRVAAASDDAEEEGPTGTTPNRMWLNSSDIELVSDFGAPTAGVQKVGLRFTGMNIPVGATITNAYLVFRAISADSPMTNSDVTNLTIKGQLTGNASTFTTTSGDISSRTLTTASAAWSPTAWTTGQDYSSPDISSVIQEIVNQGTWASGNALAMIITGTGQRASQAYDSDPSNAAQLVVTYTLTPPNTPPVNTVPGAQITNEDTSKVFSAGNGNQISITDADAGGAANQVTLSVTNGSLTLAGTAGLTFTAGDGTADATMTFRGTAAAINTALNGLSYSPTANYDGSDILTLSTIDSGIVSMNIDSSLKGFYTFDSSGDLGNDTSPLGANDGTPNIGTSAAVDGTRGDAIAMTGVDGGGVQVTGRMGSPSNVTLAAWVNLTASDTLGADVISIGDSVALRVDASGGKGLVGYIYNGSTWVGLDSGIFIAGTGWHHVAYTFDDTGNVNSLYIDGNLVMTAASTNSISYTQGANTLIGRHGNGNNSYDFNGKMDDVRVYNRALTATEVANLANDLALRDTDSVALTVTAVNDAPVITSNGGGVSAAINVTENTTAVTSVTSTDIDGGSPIYSILAGGDGAKFTINSSSGELSFVAAPDFENPTDAGLNNVYDLTVQVSDGSGGFDTQAIAVTVTNQAITSVTATGSGTVTAGSLYTLNLSANEDATSWIVNWGDGTITTEAGIATTATHAYANIGMTYSIFVSATDADGTYTESNLLTGSYSNNSLYLLDGNSGLVQQTLAAGSASGASGVTIGPDGDFFVISTGTDRVLRYDGTTGALLGTFVTAGSGGLNSPFDLAFGPDGNLYVTNYDTDQVLRYDGTTGAFIDAFVSSGSGGLDGTNFIEFGPDGNLYVSGWFSGKVHRYDGATGAFIDDFADTEGFGTTGFAFGPDGNLYVGRANVPQVFIFDGTTGSKAGQFAPAGDPYGLAFGVDGYLYVSYYSGDKIERYDISTLTSAGVFATKVTSSIDGPWGMAFTPDQQVTVTEPNNVLIVSTASDVSDGNTSSIAALKASMGADGRISLREAILATNNTANLDGSTPDEIWFQITDPLIAGAHTINVSAAGLPGLTDAVIIDGSTDRDFAGSPIIVLDGALYSGDGLRLQAGSDGSTIRGLAIYNFGGAGIHLLGSDNNTIVGNYIGTDASGTASGLGNYRGLILDNSASNQIGGSTAADRNVIVGNADDGINLWGAGTTLNVIQGNYIGVDKTGNVGLGNSADGIAIGGGANNNTIGGDRTAGEGNVISGQIGGNSDGIEIDNVGADNNKIYGNFIGTNFDGTAQIANARHGVVIYDGVQGTQVGGTGTGQGNIISGNTSWGIVVDGNNGVTTTGTVIAGNTIGLNLAGNAAIANGSGGITLFGGAQTTTIGGTTSAAHRNIISGNNGPGINITGTSTQTITVAGNYIGLATDGTTIIANLAQGVSINGGSDNNTIGGVIAASRNIISGNDGFGVYIGSGSDSNQVFNNYIGTDATGAVAKANLDGVWIDGGTNNTIGQTGAGNLISGNTYYGVTIDGATASGNKVQANSIGTDAAGTGVVANGAHGVRLLGGAHDNLIGGTSAGDENLISGNQGDGISLDADAGSGNSLLGNVIYGNLDHGIDLGNNGLTNNDVNDSDSGANSLQNFPVITQAALSGTNLTISGTLDTDGLTTQYRIEFYGNPAGTQDLTNGEARYYLGSTTVTTDGSGDAAFSGFVLNGVTLAAGDYVTATATRIDAPAQVGIDDQLAYGATSEFAANFAIANASYLTQTIPVAQNVNEDSSLVFSVANGNAISISDETPSDTPMQVFLAVSNGTLTLSQTTGLSFPGGVNGSAYMTIRGTESDINAALEGLIYAPTFDYNGADSLTVTTSFGANLVGYYTFDAGDATDDSVGISQDGTLVGDATTVTDATRGEVLSLDGMGDAISISGLFGNPASVTLAAWVNLTAADIDGAEVISLGDNVTLRLDKVGSGAGVEAFFRDGTTWQGTTSSQYLAGSGWHHVAYTFDDAANVQRLFIDGVNVATTNYTQSIVYDQGPNTYIGINASGDPNYDFNGLIDDARIYSRALSASEIASLAADQTSVTGNVAITIDPVNDAPTATITPFSFGVTEDDGYRLLSGFGVSDVDAGTGDVSATLTVTQGVVKLTNTTGLTFTSGANDSATMTFSGSISNINTALGTLAYMPDTDFNGTDTITLSVDDLGNTGGGPLSDSDNANIVVSALNDAPTITDSFVVGLPGTNEDSASTGATVSAIVNSASWNDVDSGAVRGMAITGLTGNGTWQYSDDGITWNSFGAVTATNALLLDATSQVRYVGDGVNGEVPSFDFRAWDTTTGSSSTNATPSYANPGAGGGTSAFSSESATAQTTVTSVNDAPVLDPNGTMTLTTISEDDIANSGDLVSAIIASGGGDRITDVDTGALEGIAIFDLVSSNGTWQYNTGSGWTDVGSVSIANSLLLRASDSLRFVPDGNNADTAFVTFAAWDRTTGTAGTKVDTSVYGGTTAFSDQVETAAILVTANNDSPTDLLPNSFSVNEHIDTSSGYAVGTLTTSDVDAGDTFTYTIVGGADSAKFSIGGAGSDELVITDGILDFETKSSYSVTIRTTDSGGLTYDETLTVNVNDLNEAPVASTIEGTPVAYIENDAPTQITNTIAIADFDDTNIESAIIQITGNYVNGQDFLAFTNTGTITGAWNAVAGTLTLTGSDTLANYEAALRSVTYENTSDDPSTLTRTVSFTVNDGDVDSNALTRDIDITPVNDAGVVTLNPTQLAYASGAINIDPTLTVTDADDTMLESAIVRFGAGFISSEDRLVFVDQLGITGSFNISTGTLTLTGTASVADYQTALRSVKYQDINPTPTLGTLTVNITVNDGTDVSVVASRQIQIVDDEPPRASGDNGTVAEGGAVIVDLAANDSDNNNALDLASITIISGPANGSLVDNGDGTVTYTHDGSETLSDSFIYTIKDDITLESNQATVNLTITPVNDAPQATKLNTAESFTEEIALNLTDIVVSDVDDANVTVTLTLSDVAAGSLSTGTSGAVTSTFAGGVWTASGAKSDVNTLLSGVTFTPTLDYAIDFSIATSVDDGEAAPVTGVKNFTATPVNDAPILTAGTVNNLTVNEDSGFTSLGLGSVTYGSGGGADESSQTLTIQVTVIPSPAFGDVFLADGMTKVTIGVYTLTQLQGMQFKPADDASGGPSFFSWIVVDDGGTANGGVDTLGQSIQLNVNPINDEQVLSTNTGTTVLEGSVGNVITTSMLETTDVDHTAGQLVYTVTSIPANGVLRLSGGNLSVSSTFTQADIDGGLITYLHNGTETTSDSFSFTVDDGVGSNSSGTFNITVTPVNDAPVITGGPDTSALVGTNSGLTDSGTLIVSDPDLTDNVTAAVDSVIVSGTGAGSVPVALTNAMLQGFLTVNPTAILDGTETTDTLTWDFNSGTEAFDFLANGETLILTYTVSVTDDHSTPLSDTETVTVTITGTNDAPTDIAPNSFSVNENTDTSSGFSVGTLTATDQDSGETFSYTIVGGADAGLFSIGGAGSDELILTNGVLDFETKPSYSVTVRVTDSGGLTYDETLTVTVNDLNEVPTDIAPNSFSVNENTDTSSGFSVGALTATDQDSGETFTYTIVGGADAGVFSIGGAGSDELILTNGVLDFETKPSYSVTVRVTDSGGLTYDETLTVTVNDLNEVPTDIAPNSFSVNENTDTSSGFSVGALTATDPDSGETFTYTIVGGADAGLFSIGGAGGDELILTNGVLDFETKPSYSVTVRVTDSGGLTYDETLTVTVNDLNEVPTDIAPNSFSVNENTDTSSGFSVGALTATDQDSGETFTYSIVGGADAGLLSIGGAGSDELILTSGVLDFETKPSYSVTVRVTDSGGLTYDETLTVTVNDLDEVPTDIAPNSFSVNENTDTSSGFSVGALTATDPDSGETFTYTIVGGADAGLFSIGGAGGDELILTNGVLDFETKPSYSVTVRVTDSGGLTYDETLTVTVNDLNETPTDIAPNSFSVNENTDTSSGFSVGTLTATDQDSGETFSYTIVGGADAGVFSIGGAGSDELILTNGVLDFETKPSYSVTVRVTDSGGLTYDETLTVTVNDLNEVPTDIAPNSFSVNENTDTSSGFSVGALTATDQDSGETFTYTIVGGADAGVFSIGGAGSDELILTNGVLDFETKPSYSVTVRVTDSGGLTYDETLTVTVNDLNEVPTDIAPNSFSVNENTDTSSGFSVGALTATDQDSGETFTYTIVGGADAGVFSIGGAGSDELILTNGVLDFETKPSYSVTVRVTDSGGLTYDETLTVTVNDLNETPTDIAPNSFSVNENTDTSSGFSVGALTATDQDSGETFTYTIVGGADAGVFSIGGAGSDELILTNGVLDFETQAAYSVTVRVADSFGNTYDETLAVNVNDLNETPTITSDGGGATGLVNVAENTTAVTTVTASDPDLPGDTLTYTITGGADFGQFAINSGTGVLTFISGKDFETPTDANTDGVYEVEVAVDDGSGLNDVQLISVTVTDTNETPTITSNGGGATASVNVVENTTAVTTVTATDPDLPGDTLTYTITGGADSGQFAINSGTGVLTFISGTDFETPTDADTDGVYEVEVTVDDGSGLNDVQLISVTVTDTNETPTITSDGGGATASVNVVENTTAVTTVTATDPDLPGDTLTYTITGGADAGDFNINSSTGVLTFVAGKDYEIPSDTDLDGIYEVQVTVDDGNGLNDVQAISVIITDANDAPVITSDGGGATASVNVTENTTAVTTVTATDEDVPADTLTYTITGGADSTQFAVDSSTGVLTFIAGKDLESPTDADTNGIYEVEVTVDDGNGLNDIQTIHVTVTDVNENPTITSDGGGATASINVDENATTVTTVTSSDPDLPPDALTYTITGGADSTQFSIDSSTGVLTFVSGRDFEIPSDADTDGIYQVVVTVDDGNGGTDIQTIDVAIGDVNETPTDIAANSFAIDENIDTTPGTSLGTLTATDEDAGDTFTFSIAGGPDAASFSIGGAGSNELMITDGVLDYETQSSYSVLVRVTDAGGLSYTELLTVNVNDLNEAPTVSLANLTTNLTEDTDTTSAIKMADIVIADDALGTNNLSLSGADAADFEIVGTELRLKAGTTLDFETQSSFDVTVEVDDTSVGGTPDDFALHTLNIDDVNEAPSVSLANLITNLTEDTDTSTAIRVADIVITDDALGTNNLTLSGADAADFEIVGTELRLRAGTTLDFESKTSFDVTIEVDDTAVGATPDDTANHTLNVDDANESPTVSLINLVGTLPENTDTTSSIRVADIAVSDDALGTNNLTLSGADAAIFEIVGTELRLRAGTTLDFETQSAFDVTVEVDDIAVGGTPDDTAAHTLNLTDVNEAPSVSLTNLVANLAENADTTTAIRVADIVIADDALGTNNLTLSGADAADFEIVGTELRLRAGTTLDFETKTAFDVTVEVDDTAVGSSPDDTAMHSLNITDVNEAPTDIAPDSFNVDENTDTSGGWNLGLLTTTDEDGGESFTYAIVGGTDAASFTMGGTNGDELIFNDGILDFESQSTYSVIVEVTDSGGNTYNETLTVNINDLNESPTDISPDAFAVNENVDTSSGLTVGILTTADEDGGETFSYAIIGGADAVNFTIGGTNGDELILNDGVLDFESKSNYSVIVEVTDSAGNTYNETLTVNVNDLNEAPTDIDPNSFTVSENTDTSGGFSVGTLNSVDEDSGETFSYAIIGGADAGNFTIGGTNGDELILDDGLLDFETKSSYSVTVEVTDSGGNRYNETLAVNVTDINEAPTDINPNAFAVNENVDTSGGLNLGTVTATDEDAGESFNYAIIGGADSGNFVLGGINGDELIFDDGVLDYEAKSIYSVIIEVTDSAGNTYNETLTLNVNDLNESPTDLNPNAFTVNENVDTSSGFSVGTLTTIDQDSGETFSYAIIGGADAGNFTIGGTNGDELVLSDGILDFETKSTYNVMVEVTDSGGNTYSETLTVNVNDLNEAPTDLSPDAFSVDENVDTSGGLSVGLLSTTDEDGGETFTYAVIGGADVTSFSIGGTNGDELIFNDGVLDFERQSTYAVVVEVRDSGGNTYTETLTLNINDLNEAPVVNDQAFTVNENSANGTSVGFVASADADAGDSVTYTITGGSGATAFSLDSASGEITVADVSQLDFETSPSLTLTIEVRDSGGLIDSATITINLNDINDEQVLVTNNPLSVDEGLSGTITTALLNTTDQDQGPASLSYTVTTAPANGLLLVSGIPSTTFTQDDIDNGRVVYQHDGSETAADSFDFEVDDGIGTVSAGTFVLNIAPVNDAPVVADDTAVVNEGGTLSGTSGDLLGNDFDAEGDLLTASLVTGPTNGSLVLNPDGSFTYTHDGSETSSDSFQYRVNDGSANSNIATVEITVVPVNDAPIGNGETYAVPAGLSLTELVGVLANDIDAESNAITAILFSGPSNGSLVLNSDGSFTYVPDPGFVGSDSFVYQPFDGLATGVATTVTLDVVSPPPPPGPGPIIVPKPKPGPDPEPDPESDPDPDPDPDPIKSLIDPVRNKRVEPKGTGSGQFEVQELGPQYLRYLADVNHAGAVLEMLIANVSPDIIQDADELRRLRLLSGLGIAFDANFLWSQMDDLAESNSNFDFSFSVGAITAVGTLGYILWSLRGGVLVATALAQLPSWRMIDPLPVLESYSLKKAQSEADDVGGYFE